MKKRLLGVLAFALAVSAGAAFVLYQLISSRVQASAPAAKPTTSKVFVAARDLELGALIQERDVTTKEYLSPPTGAILKKEDIVGRGVTNTTHQDSPFYEGFLAPRGGGAGFASTIPRGMRAFAVHVNEVVGVAGFAVAGMHVDILVSGTQTGTADGSTGSVARTLLQNIQVLSAGQNFQKDAEGKPVLVQVVNLLVTPDQAEVLNLATEHSIQLVLRNPADHDIVATRGATTASLFSGGAPSPRVEPPPPPAPKPAPAVEIAPKPVPRTVTIEVFAGDKKAEAVFAVKPAASLQPEQAQGGPREQ
jgi:pilus assembly protein CpaB